MFRRVWTPTEWVGDTTESKIIFYDFGVYYGEQVDNEWTCWEIHSREMNERGEIIEELWEMPQDWVPFDTFNRETYSGAIRLQGAELQIQGWIVRTEPAYPPVESPVISLENPSQLNCKSGHPLQAPHPSQLHRTLHQSRHNERVSGARGVKPISSNRNEYNSINTIVSTSQGLSQTSYHTSPQLEGLQEQATQRQKQHRQSVPPDSAMSETKSYPQAQAPVEQHSSAMSETKILQGQGRGQGQGRRVQKHASATSGTKSLQQAPLLKQTHQNQLTQAEKGESALSEQQPSLKTKKALNSVSAEEKKYIKKHPPKQFWIPLVQVVQKTP